MITRRTPLAASLTMTLGLTASACDTPPVEGPQGPVRRDSAGIELVDHSSLPPGGFGGWVVDPAPYVRIGTMDGPEDQQLFRVSGARLLADGRVVVANVGSADLRYFDTNGDYLSSEGRRGGGPGEYEQPDLVGIMDGDTLVVGDFRNNRVSLVHPTEGFIRSFPASESSSFGFTRGVLSDGTVVRGGGILFGSNDELASGFRRDAVTYELTDPVGGLLAELGSFPGPEMQVDVGENFVSAMSVPFSRNTIAEAAGDRIILGTNDDYSLQEFSTTGELVRLIRSLEPLRPVTEAMKDAAFEERIADADDEDEVRRLRNARQNQRTPETLPAYQSILVDRTGLAWVQDYRTPLDTESNWTVFDRTGGIVARLAVPPDLTLMDVGSDYVLGRVVDDLGVEYIQLHRLHREAPTP